MKPPRGFCATCNQEVPITIAGKPYGHRNRRRLTCQGSQRKARPAWIAPPVQRQGWEIRWANLDHGTTWEQIEREYTGLGWEPFTVIQLPNSCVFYFRRPMAAPGQRA